MPKNNERFAESIQEEEQLFHVKKARLEYAFSQDDEAASNHTYKEELRLLEAIRDGDVNLVRKNCKEFFLQYPQLIRMNPKKNEEYIAVACITIAARVAIEAGITSAESFQLSDAYLKKLAATHESQAIIKHRNNALIAFAELIHERKSIKKSNTYVEECKKYIVTNTFKKITVQEVAESVGLTANYAERIFREATGLSIGSYIQKEKITRAKNLLIYLYKLYISF